MSSRRQGFLSLAVEVFGLARSYGRKKLAVAFAMIVLQGIFQVVGVTSIFPFLAIASDPNRFRDSALGRVALTWLPPLSDRELLLYAGSASILMLLVSNAVALLGDVNRARFSNGVGYHLRVQLLRRITDQPYGYFLERNTSAISQKLQSDVLLYVNNVLSPMLELGSSLLGVALLLATIMAVDPWIPLCAAILIGSFYLLAGSLLRPKSIALGERLKAANRGSSKALQQYLQGIKTILVQNRTKFFFDEYERFIREQRAILPRILLFAGGPKYLIEPLAFGGLVSVVLVFAIQGEGLSEILPSLGILALAAYRLLPEAQKAYSKFNNISTYRYVVGEVRSELDADFSVASPPPKSLVAIGFERRIWLEDIVFKYPKSRAPVLDGVSLEIEKNKSLGIVGPTGSGKSTLVDLLLGLHLPQSGRFVVDDKVLGPEDMPAWRSMIGYVPQDIYLLDDTIAANIAFGVPSDHVDRHALERAAEAAQIRDFVESDLAHKWDTVVGERGVRLSGGQRQRIGLARALYHQPSILILDEATSALDHETEGLVLEAIERLRGAMTMIVIAHRLHTIERCDRVYRMGSGSAT